MQARFNCKDGTIYSNTFVIDKTVELSKDLYDDFCKAPLDVYKFLDEFEGTGYFDENGKARCGLVLCRGQDDGVLVLTEGYEYARYTSYLPCARQIDMLSRYPSLDRYAQNMARIADQYVSSAVEEQIGGKCYIEEASVADNIEKTDEAVNVRLFLDMITDRSEVSDVSLTEDSFCIIIDEDHINQSEPLKELSQEDVDIICAKHTLWLHDVEGGKQADFSGCFVREQCISNRNLNNAIFDGAYFYDVEMRNCEACFASFEEAKFEHCDMANLVAEECNFRDATIRKCYAEDSAFTHSNFTRAKFLDSSANGSTFKECCMENIDTRGTTDINLADESLSFVEEEWLSQYDIAEDIREISI